jgi:hypothetical protein
MNEITTTNLSEFSHRELHEVETLLKAMREQGLPEDFYDEEVHPMFNKCSGFVFLTNSEYQVALMNGDSLESFYSCPECGYEGFLDEMKEGNDCCIEWLKESGLIEDEEDEEEI